VALKTAEKIWEMTQKGAARGNELEKHSRLMYFGQPIIHENNTVSHSATRAAYFVFESQATKGY
jgi:hypothetical protein